MCDAFAHRTSLFFRKLVNEFRTNWLRSLTMQQVILGAHIVETVYLGEECEEGLADCWGRFAESFFTGEDFFFGDIAGCTEWLERSL